MKVVAEGSANPCGSCDQTFDEQIEIFLTTPLKQLHRAVENDTVVLNPFKICLILNFDLFMPFLCTYFTSSLMAI